MIQVISCVANNHWVLHRNPRSYPSASRLISSWCFQAVCICYLIWIMLMHRTTQSGCATSIGVILFTQGTRVHVLFQRNHIKCLDREAVVELTFNPQRLAGFMKHRDETKEIQHTKKSNHVTMCATCVTRLTPNILFGQTGSQTVGLGIWSKVGGAALRSQQNGNAGIWSVHVHLLSAASTAFKTFRLSDPEPAAVSPVI